MASKRLQWSPCLFMRKVILGGFIIELTPITSFTGRVDISSRNSPPGTCPGGRKIHTSVWTRISPDNNLTTGKFSLNEASPRFANNGAEDCLKTEILTCFDLNDITRYTSDKNTALPFPVDIVEAKGARLEVETLT